MIDKGPAKILGGLPVWIEIKSGFDEYNNESWSEVISISWLKRNGKPGKPLPQHVIDRAYEYDYGLDNTVIRFFEDIDAKEYEQRQRQERLKLIDTFLWRCSAIARDGVTVPSKEELGAIEDLVNDFRIELGLI
jgi:hypothetical protein